MSDDLTRSERIRVELIHAHLDVGEKLGRLVRGEIGAIEFRDAFRRSCDRHEALAATLAALEAENRVGLSG